MGSLNNKIAKFCEKEGFKDPLELLIALTNGVDLREQCPVFTWLANFEEVYGDKELPELEQWYELKELIRSSTYFRGVTIAESLNAQKTLLEYQHPKKRSVDVSTQAGEGGEVSPLTYSEIRKFRRKFKGLI